MAKKKKNTAKKASSKTSNKKTKPIKHNFSKNKTGIGFELANIKIDLMSYSEPSPILLDAWDLNKFILEYNIAIAPKLEEDVLAIFISGGLNNPEGTDEFFDDLRLLDFGFAFDFKVDNLSEGLLNEQMENLLENKEQLLGMLSVAYSTARGILFAKTLGSIFNQFMLPIVTPAELLDNLSNSMMALMEDLEDMDEFPGFDGPDDFPDFDDPDDDKDGNGMENLFKL